MLASLASQYEVVLVNDGSRDQSWKVIQELSRMFPWIRGINLMRNYGQHNALLCGIRAARVESRKLQQRTSCVREKLKEIWKKDCKPSESEYNHVEANNCRVEEPEGGKYSNIAKLKKI